jgi:hypothetical protein
LVDTLEEGRLRHILGRGYGQGLAIQQAVVSETDVGPSSVDVALCARALSVAYRVLAIDDPLQANPRGVKLWEWESRALGLEHFAEFVRVEIARAEGRTHELRLGQILLQRCSSHSFSIRDPSTLDAAFNEEYYACGRRD